MEPIDFKNVLENRLNKTDQKIDRNNEELKALREDLYKYNIKTAVLENQMAGVTKIGFIILAAIIGIITFGIKKGIF